MSVIRTRSRHVVFLSLILVFLLLLSNNAQADMYDSSWEWGVVENNSGTPVTAQLSLDVTDLGNNQVQFTFFNALGGASSSITGIYFDDGALLGISSIDNSDPGVSFTHPATSPSELKGANNLYPIFETSAGFSAQSVNPPYHEGVNPDESVGIVFNLITGKTFTDVINAINVGFNPDVYYTGIGAYDGWDVPSLRIGINVQGIGPDDQSDSYILTPVPGAALLGLLGLGAAGMKLRRFV